MQYMFINDQTSSAIFGMPTTNSDEKCDQRVFNFLNVCTASTYLPSAISCTILFSASSGVEKISTSGVLRRSDTASFSSGSLIAKSSAVIVSVDRSLTLLSSESFIESFSSLEILALSTGLSGSTLDSWDQYYKTFFCCN